MHTALTGHLARPGLLNWRWHWHCLEIFIVVTDGGGALLAFKGRGQGCAKHPAMHRALPYKKDVSS